MSSKAFETTTFLRDGLTLALAVCAAAAMGGFIATNGRSKLDCLIPLAGAAACCLMVFLPAIAIRNCLFLGTNRTLASLAWRFPTSLATILAVYGWDGLQRKCFIAALLTCYFIALPLESWLQIRQSRRVDSFSGSRSIEKDSKAV